MPTNPRKRLLTNTFRDQMYDNMWQFMNPDTLKLVLDQAGCGDTIISEKKDVYDDNWLDGKGPRPDGSYRNTICFKGNTEDGHYVYINDNNDVWGTYECQLIYKEDDGMCHGGALAAAFYHCGIEVGPLVKNPKSREEFIQNYKVLLNTYLLIINKGYWDNALRETFYRDVDWINKYKTTKQTQIVKRVITERLAQFV